MTQFKKIQLTCFKFSNQYIVFGLAKETGNIELVDLFVDNFKFWNNNLLQYKQPDQTTETDWGAYVSIDKTCSKAKGDLRANSMP